jgi:acyl carrier protein
MTGDLDAFATVRDAVAIVCEVDPASLSLATRFEELGADSLARVSIADVVETEVLATTRRSIHIDDATLGRLASLAELADYIAAAR